MVIDYFWGRPADQMSRRAEDSGNLELHVDALTMATPLFYKFVHEYGSILCSQIMMRILGRLYYFLDEDEMLKFEKAGGHQDKCTRVVGDAARWTVKILLDKGAVRL